MTIVLTNEMGINRIVFMDFIHRLLSQDQKTKIIDKKLKT